MLMLFLFCFVFQFYVPYSCRGRVHPGLNWSGFLLHRFPQKKRRGRVYHRDKSGDVLLFSICGKCGWETKVAQVPTGPIWIWTENAHLSIYLKLLFMPPSRALPHVQEHEGKEGEGRIRISYYFVFFNYVVFSMYVVSGTVSSGHSIAKCIVIYPSINFVLHFHKIQVS